MSRIMRAVQAKVINISYLSLFLLLVVCVVIISFFLLVANSVLLYVLFILYALIITCVVLMQVYVIHKTVRHNQVVLEDAMENELNSRIESDQLSIWKDEITDELQNMIYVLTLFESHQATHYIKTESEEQVILTLVKMMNMNLLRMSNALKVVKMLTRGKSERLDK